MRMTTVSSGLTTTQALTSSGAPRACAASGLTGREAGVESRPRQPAADDEPRRSMRSERCEFDFRNVIHDGLLHALAAAWIAGAHALEGAAAADVGDRRVDVGVGRLRLLLEQRRDRHDHAALAVAALRNIVIDPGLLHLVQHAVLREPFDRGDLLAGHRGERHRARAHGDAVDVHGAGAALRDAAAVFRAGQSDLFTQAPRAAACRARHSPHGPFH